jgi:hypothetical protein
MWVGYAHQRQADGGADNSHRLLQGFFSTVAAHVKGQNTFMGPICDAFFPIHLSHIHTVTQFHSRSPVISDCSIERTKCLDLQMMVSISSYMKILYVLNKLREEV